jgi:predicted MFS family arabinose efflux permease
MALPRPESPTSPSPAEPRATAYSWYVLAVLTLVYVSNHVDRQILAILIGPIKEEFGVSDKMIGLLAGPAFALFYTFLGLPIARWADRGSRRSIIALGLAVWSGMTALAGMAQSFTQLALARIGVATGEAAGSPPAHSLISDYFPPETRGRALGLYAGGLHIAGPIGFIAGSQLEDLYDWRVAFLAVGLPGLLLALLVRFTIREPERGRMDRAPLAEPRQDAWAVLRELFGRRSYLHLQLGGTLHAAAGYGMGIWIAEFLIRVHDLSRPEAGTYIGVLHLAAGAIGVVLGGWLTDRLSPRDARWFLWLPSLQAIVGIPFVLLFLYLDDVRWALALYSVHWVLNASYNAPIYALMQTLATARTRALSVATHLFIVNLLGLGLGPLAIGVINDALRGSYGDHAIRYSMTVAALTNAAATIFYLLGARSVREDVAAAQRG